jgi:Spy/CpxP family protein refolding chaperone
MSDRITWSHPKVMMALLAVFLAGAAAGAFVTKLIARGAFGGSARLAKQMDRKELLDYFQQELNLTGKQQQQVSSLLDDHFKYLQTLGAQMEEVRLHGRESIAKCLEPEQRKKFDKLMLDWQRAQR